MYFKKAMLFTIILSSYTISNAVAQTANDYGVEANIIYRFTKYIDWPQNKKDDFVIGVIGEAPLYDELKRYTLNKTVGTKKITVVNFLSNASAYNCQILIVTEDASSDMKRIARATAAEPILIVSEQNGLARKGACINFVLVNGHLRLEFNKNNIEERNLKVATELLNLGTIIN